MGENQGKSVLPAETGYDTHYGYQPDDDVKNEFI